MGPFWKKMLRPSSARSKGLTHGADSNASEVRPGSSQVLERSRNCSVRQGGDDFASVFHLCLLTRRDFSEIFRAGASVQLRWWITIWIQECFEAFFIIAWRRCLLYETKSSFLSHFTLECIRMIVITWGPGACRCECARPPLTLNTSHFLVIVNHLIF